MAAFKNFPVPLKEKLVTVIFIAAFILLAGSVAAVVFKDIIMFILSLLLCVFNLIRAVSLYKTVSGNKYEIVEGRCTEISSVLIRKNCDRGRRRTVFYIRQTLKNICRERVQILFQGNAENLLRQGHYGAAAIGRLLFGV